MQLEKKYIYMKSSKATNICLCFSLLQSVNHGNGEIKKNVFSSANMKMK